MPRRHRRHVVRTYLMARIFRGVVDYGEKGDFYYTRHGPNETNVHSTIPLTDRPWYYQIPFFASGRDRGRGGGAEGKESTDSGVW